MEEEKNTSYLMFESAQARSERTNKRLWILCILLIVTLVGTNAGWLWWESQWAYVKSSTEVSQELDAEGNAIINDGVHINEQSETNSKDNNGN